MVTIILMLVLMMGPNALARALGTVMHRSFDRRCTAAFGLALLFLFAGVGHFAQTEVMAQMLPPWMPARMAIIYATGVLELAVAAGFLFRRTTRPTGWIAAGMLVLFFPANIYAAIHYVPMGGHVEGPIYLLLRAPLQAIILLWVYWFALRPLRRSASA